jgi:mRNA interferase RelE/StbE
VEITPKAESYLKKLDRHTLIEIKEWIGKNLEGCEDPRRTGKALSGTDKGKWRYRIGDYRLIATIYDDRLLILLVGVGHRKNIYLR